MTTDYLSSGQPDILEVIANLSNDAVFTPPRVVNAVLDLLPSHVWSDPSLRWLDPGAKTGVFLREITKRLMGGLAEAIRDEDARLNHILREMVFAIATEEITGMMSRRSLYCSKDASSAHSVVRFDDPAGNIWQKRVKHDFDIDGRCRECKGSREQLLQQGRDSKAYAFIHADGRSKIEREIEMKFDVIVGNPPYQMTGGGGGTNDTPLYNIFVAEAIKLNPRYLSMIIPSRWMAGGRGLESFRAEMLGDQRIRQLVDYPDSSEFFPAVKVMGGICYFLWDRDNPGLCATTLVRGGRVEGPTERRLDEYDVLVRDPRALDILRKVKPPIEQSFSAILSSDTPFGIATNYKGYKDKAFRGAVPLYAYQGGARIVRWISRSQVPKSAHLIDTLKVLIPSAGFESQILPTLVLSSLRRAPNPSVCTQTYLCVPAESEDQMDSIESYIRTRFFRFLVWMRKVSQHAPRSTYQWVPQQSWDRIWTDAELYKKYGITEDEQSYIAEMIREMPA
jgi:site-specific DNA-methyltransferase (adenine-specific)